MDQNDVSNDMQQLLNRKPRITLRDAQAHRLIGWCVLTMQEKGLEISREAIVNFLLDTVKGLRPYNHGRLMHEAGARLLGWDSELASGKSTRGGDA